MHEIDGWLTVVRWLMVAALLTATVLVVSRLIGGSRQHGDSAVDASHVLMSVLMVAMFVDPTALAPHVSRGLLLALAIALGMVLVDRLRARVGPPSGASDIATHLIAVGAMSYALDQHDQRPSVFAYALAVLLLAAAFSGARPLPGQRRAFTDLVPHVVMNCSAAFMLIGMTGTQ
ncbi:DUF5134 domain-containing protein [Nocardia camponoti]|uniref:Uncharacterized protein n=1 Tax=Nocardia camponoti TaxID=1616106 RepID=A0A917QBI2_9NOCA|nr:DUF5134 domain-containing protein [Nocardia camponoti]GGK41479.1 hypothetical protein GCM10011591_11200 [Nocardia camponoti]